MDNPRFLFRINIKDWLCAPILHLYKMNAFAVPKQLSQVDEIEREAMGLSKV